MAIEVRDENLELAKAILAAIASFEDQKLPLPTEPDGTCYLRDMEKSIDPAILAKIKPAPAEKPAPVEKAAPAGKRTPKAVDPEPEPVKEEAPAPEPVVEPTPEPVVEPTPEPAAEEPVKAQTVTQQRAATRR